VCLNESKDVCVCFQWVEWMEVGGVFDIGGFGVLMGGMFDLEYCT